MAASSQLSISNLSFAISDVHYVTHGGLFKPDYDDLLTRLNEIKREAASEGSSLEVALPEDYQTAVLRRFISFLNRLGRGQFNHIFQGDVARLGADQRFYKRIIPDIAEALLQRDCERAYYKSAHDDLLAFQAVVNSIYEVTVASDIRTISRAILPPLAKWGKGKGRGPYTWTITKTHRLDLGLYAGIVSLPSDHRDGGLLAWATLGHEIAGHNFLCSNSALLPELEQCVFDRICSESTIGNETKKIEMATYWKRCIEEIASDVLGVFNIGPVAAIAFIGYLRGVRGGKLKADGIFPLEGNEPVRRAFRLSSNPSEVDLLVREVPRGIDLPKKATFLGEIEGDGDLHFKPYFMNRENHPVDILRPFVLTRVIEDMSGEFAQWATLVEEETYKDYPEAGTIELTSVDASRPDPEATSIEFEIQSAIEAGKIAAMAIINSPLECFDGRTLKDIFSWGEREQGIVEEFKVALGDEDEINFEAFQNAQRERTNDEFYARYIVSAATELSLCLTEDQGHRTEIIFRRMKTLLTQAYIMGESLRDKRYTITRLDLHENETDPPSPRHYF